MASAAVNELDGTSFADSDDAVTHVTVEGAVEGFEGCDVCYINGAYKRLNKNADEYRQVEDYGCILRREGDKWKIREC